MRKVFVPNKGVQQPGRPPHDYSEAWNFGELIFCTQGELNRVDVLTMQAELERAMGDATPEDIILVSSLTTLCSVACGIFASKFNRLNLLLFENGHYILRQVFFNPPSNEAQYAKRATTHHEA